MTAASDSPGTAPAFLARRLSGVRPSATDTVSALARTLRAQGRSVINLAIGEPALDTPQHVKEAAHAAIRAGETKYTAVPGTQALRESICAKFQRDNRLHFTPEQVTIGCGGKQIIANAFLATLNPGDEVVIPAPYWVSYPEMVALAEGTTRVVPTREQDDFKLRPEILEAALTPRTKWLVLNSPSNPTGATYTRAELRALADVLLRFPHVWILSDDLYEHFVYDQLDFETLAAVEPLLGARTLTLNGVSKAYAMTGWRVGYAGGPLELIRAINTVQSQTCTHTSSISQAAAVAALNGSQDFVTHHRALLHHNRTLVVDGLRGVPGLRCPVPQGAFYAYVSCQDLIGKVGPDGSVIHDDLAFANYLLDSRGVAVLPGVACGMSPYVRLSFACAPDILQDACARIARACGALH